MNWAFTLTISVFLFLHLGMTQARACTCGSELSACEAYGEAAAVFIGKAVDQSTHDEGPFATTEYLIQVKEVFVGNLGKTITASVGPYGCGFNFRIGKEYLIYAGMADGTDGDVDRFTATSCSRTRLLSAAAEDLKFLRKDIKQMNGSRIYGWIKEDRSGDTGLPLEKRTPPIKGFGLKLLGPNQTYDLTTDANGDYSLDGLSSGKYFIELISTTEYYTEGRERQEFFVNPRGCAANNVYLRKS